MTIPWLMNCPHSETGWCLDCVRQLGLENDWLRGINSDAHKVFEAEVNALQMKLKADRHS
jgi:hypothetical protein